MPDERLVKADFTLSDEPGDFKKRFPPLLISSASKKPAEDISPYFPGKHIFCLVCIIF